jgi:hypothetical protein
MRVTHPKKLALLSMTDTNKANIGDSQKKKQHNTYNRL